MSLSLIVHTRNSAETLPRLLETTAWIEERIVVDMGSTDSTAALAEEAGCHIETIEPSDQVDAIRNTCLRFANHEWLLVLDSDEYLSSDAQTEITRLIKDNGSAFDAFAIPRFNTIAGQLMRGGQWYPDRQIRLFRKGSVAWQPGHHQPVEVKTGLDRLMSLSPPDCLHIHHSNYASVADFVERQVKYALTDSYSDDFDFHRDLKRAYQEFESRFDVEADGDLSTALAIVMSWDKVIRGVLHWEKTGKAGPLESAFTLPIAVDMPETEELVDLRERVAAMQASTSWRMTAPLRWVSTAIRSMRANGNALANDREGAGSGRSDNV